jgi:hypothetical protein
MSKEEINVADDDGQAAVMALEQRALCSLAECILQREDPLARNSRNCRKPPSNHGGDPGAPHLKSLRGHSLGMWGGQFGHRGEKLNRAVKPEVIKVYSLQTYQHCDHSLKHTKVSRHEKLQVDKWRGVQVQLPEHRARFKMYSSDGKKTRACFPVGMSRAVRGMPGASVRP